MAVQVWPLYDTTAPPLYAVVETHAAAVQVPDPPLVGVELAVAVGVPPEQAPLSVHTPCELLPGVSPWVHHFAVQVWPLYETTAPPLYAVVADHAAAVHEPVPPDGEADADA